VLRNQTVAFTNNSTDSVSTASFLLRRWLTLISVLISVLVRLPVVHLTIATYTLIRLGCYHLSANTAHVG